MSESRDEVINLGAVDAEARGFARSGTQMGFAACGIIQYLLALLIEQGQKLQKLAPPSPSEPPVDLLAQVKDDVT